MDDQKLLTQNLVELAKVQEVLKGMRNYLDKLYAKIEMDDPSGKDQLFAPLWMFFNSTADAIELIKKNTDDLMIDQGFNQDLN